MSKPNSTGFYRFTTGFYRQGNQPEIRCYNSGVLEESLIETEKSADAADTVTEDVVSGFAIRFCPGPRPSLRYQAGRIVKESRYVPLYKTGNLVLGWKTVSLFHLLGHGETKEEAIEMAEKNPNRRNGL